MRGHCAFESDGSLILLFGQPLGHNTEVINVPKADMPHSNTQSHIVISARNPGKINPAFPCMRRIVEDAVSGLAHFCDELGVG